MESFILAANVLQIGLTVVFVGLCVHLFWAWGPSYWAALKALQAGGFRATILRREVWTANQWLLVGIVSSFFGAISDQLYWGLTWTVVLYDTELGTTLLDAGPIGNVVFRQSIGIWAVYCHLVGAQMTHDSPTRVPLLRYSLAGLVVVGILCVEAFL